MPLLNRITFQFTVIHILVVTFVLLGSGCHYLLPQAMRTNEDCVDQIIERLEKLPEKKTLKTIDGQEVSLWEFFTKCDRSWPSCVLPHKFYYWKSEIKEIVSKSSTGPIKHKIRIYHNVFSTCYPDKYGIDKDFGDVAEFYDTKGAFMGLAVCAGNGSYFPLPYSRYKKTRAFNYNCYQFCVNRKGLNNWYDQFIEEADICQVKIQRFTNYFTIGL